jgi:hypothetical protein
MHFWQTFWTISVLVAGLSFAFVTLVVTLRGGRDLAELFTRLLEQKRHGDDDIAR